MIVGKAIYYLLTNATDVTDIVSTRVYPEVAQQDADLPFIVYNVTNNEPSDTKPEPSKLDTAQVEVNIYSDSYTEAIDLAVAVRAALDRVKGTYNGVNVQSIQYQNEVIDFDEPQRAYNISADYDVRISRSGFEIAQGSPITGVQLGELSDVDVTGVTNGQLIAYNETTGNWEAANDAGGAETLDDLTDVDAGAPSSGQLLAYGQDTWETIAQDELTLPIGSVTGLQAALDAAPDNLRELTDVTISGLADNDYLQYDSVSGTWQNSSLILGRNGEQYTGNYDSEAETLLDGATATVELYYTAQADGDGLHEDAQTDTATTGYDIRRKLYYAEKAQADPNTSGDWTQFTAIADNTTFANAKAALLAYLKERTGGTVPISLKMTWEEVAQAPAFTGLLNESYGSGAAAAYSVRRLNGNYTGAAIQVERSSDNTTQDIGFDSNGDLDESALTTFCTGTTCKVRTWYDQSVTGGTGSGNDAVQTTHANQPTIYTGGAIVKENGRVAFNSTSGDSGLSAAVSGASAAYLFTVASSQDSAARMILASSSSQWMLPAMDGSTTTASKSGVTLNNIYLSGSSYSYSTWGQMFDDTTIRQLITTDINNSAWTTLDFGWASSSTYGMYQMQEAIFYTSDKSTDRTSIESNIGDYFTQNTPLLDTYTGAAAAYSLRKLRTAFSGSAIRVRRASDNTEQDIGFNVFGELDTVSLASFCSGTNGFVKTWYDQSGNANDATQTNTANQPKIYDSSTGVVTENGKPIINLVAGSSSTLLLSTQLSSATQHIFAVAEIDQTDFLVMIGTQNGTGVYVARNGDTASAEVGASLYINGSTSSISNRDELSDQFQNQTLLSSIQDLSSSSNDQTRIGMLNGSGDSFKMFNMQEIIFYSSEQSATNRDGIHTNMNTFYSIY